MAKVILSKEEARKYRVNKRFRSEVADALYMLAGNLGGNGIDVVDEEGNDLSSDDYPFSYGPGKDRLAAFD